MDGVILFDRKKALFIFLENVPVAIKLSFKDYDFFHNVKNCTVCTFTDFHFRHPCCQISKLGKLESGDTIELKKMSLTFC